jgi:hypothetical protein
MEGLLGITPRDPTVHMKAFRWPRPRGVKVVKSGPAVALLERTHQCLIVLMKERTALLAAQGLIHGKELSIRRGFAACEVRGYDLRSEIREVDNCGS